MPTVSIYLSEEVFLDVTKVAEEKDISVSKVLASSFRGPVKEAEERSEISLALTRSAIMGRLDRIEEKLDNLVKVYRIDNAESPVAELGKIRGEDKLEKARYDHKYVEGWSEVISEHLKDQVDDAQELKQANERLLKKRKEIPNAIKTASDLPDRYKSPEFSGGVPKAKWK